MNLNDCDLGEKVNEVMFHHLEGLGNDLALTKLGYKYNDLYDD